MKMLFEDITARIWITLQPIRRIQGVTYSEPHMQKLLAELTNRLDSCHIRSVKQQRFWPAYIRYIDVIG